MLSTAPATPFGLIAPNNVRGLSLRDVAPKPAFEVVERGFGMVSHASTRIPLIFASHFAENGSHVGSLEVHFISVAGSVAVGVALAPARHLELT